MQKKKFKYFFLPLMLTVTLNTFLIFLLGCTSSKSSESTPTIPAPNVSLGLTMTRLAQAGVDPFQVDVSLSVDGQAQAGKTLELNVPKGVVSAITDHADGTYSFTVTPSVTGTYPVTVSYSGSSITRKAVVLDSNVTGSGQPMAVPGDYVNTEGYEDGATITPDGQYLFVQYGPFYFSGISNFTTICSSGSYTAGYDLGTCDGRTNSNLVFDIKGPTTAPYRPRFPTGAFAAGKLRHLSLVLPGVANGIVAFPTVFYGFKKQSDGTFAEPFKVSFDDDRGINGPFGLSFQMNGDGTAKFAVAWNNYFNDLGDDKADIYTGTMTMGQDNSLGTVTYSGETFASIVPNISPISFSSHVGTQGNPHLYYDGSGVIKSVWTDDETTTKNLSVYRITSGTYPTGTWVKDTLPSIINTAAEEDQPFFTGDRLIFSRDGNIVSHNYQPLNGACASTYTSNDCWGPEVILVGANGHLTPGEIFSVGEPTVATIGSKKYLYFIYVESRALLPAGIYDFNLDVAFVEIP